MRNLFQNRRPSQRWRPGAGDPEAIPSARSSNGERISLARQEDDDRTPRRQQDVPDRVGHGITEYRKLALRLVLDGAERGGDRPGAGAGAEEDDRVHLE